jgi:monoamine oxidase
MAIQNIFNNPTNEQRHELLYQSLERAGRTEDYENVIELLSPPTNILEFAAPMSMRNLNIGIIGGGLAGLSAAYELRKLGANITIFDAEGSRIGGRIYTHFFNNRQYYGEFGAMRIPVSHETTWHYINLFNINTESLSSPLSNNFIFSRNVRMRRDRTGENIEENLYPLYSLTAEERNTPWNDLVSYASDTMLNSLTPAHRTEILKIMPRYSEEYASITNLSNRQVYEKLGLSQGFINLLSSVDPFAGATLNISHDESMSGTYTLDFLNTYRISGGMVNLPLAFINSLVNSNPLELRDFSVNLGKVNIKFGHIVNGLAQTSNDYVNVHYTNPYGNELTESFDLVICTIPYSTLREMELNPYFTDKKMQAIKELNYIDAQKTICLFNKRFWEEDTDYGKVNGGISFTDLIIQSIVYPPDHIRCENENCSYLEPGVLIASYNLGLDSFRLSNQNQFRRMEIIKRDVEKVHGTPPNYLDSLIDSSKTVQWNNEQWSRGGFAVPYPGQKVDLSYSMLLPEYNNKVFFAGEHISTKPGWMQGALQTGKWVANQIALFTQ